MRGESVALLFTDIQGSTGIVDRLGERFGELLAEHHRVMREAIDAAGGREVRTAGDSFFAVFPRAQDAAECAGRVQAALSAARWPDGTAPLVRMGIHTGAPRTQDGEFYGMDVHRAARVMAVAHGGQVLLTKEAREALGAGIQTRDLGYHRLKDLPAPEHVFQLLTPELQREFPPLRSLNRTNLPTPTTLLVGRAVEVAGALARLARPEVRLLTLLGAGGTGKTRLAIEIAAEAVPQYRDGVWLVPLAPLQDPALMISEIARVVEVDAAPGEPVERALVGALADRELLLVLDNFEHLLQAAGVVAEVLATAPRVDVLATSREPLRISGEYRLDVPPLASPDAHELFVQRALAVRPELVLDDEEATAVQRICARLEGLPLALELAAARTAVFLPRALEARLAEGLPLPDGPRDLPERQRTLRATIDWSYRLLDAAEQRLLASLSPFVGGIRVDTAEQLWGLEGVENLISLTEKSLFRRREDPDGEPRFWMLELIRQYGLEVARTAGTADLAADRHARAYFRLTEEARPHLIGPTQRRWPDRLEREHPNLRAALEHLTSRRSDDALRMASTLTWFWDMRGYQPEALRRLDDALAAAAADSPNLGDALHCAGWMAWARGDPEMAQSLQHAALPLVERSGDQRILGLLYTHLGTVADMLRDHDEAMRWHERAIATARAAGDDWALGLSLNNYALARRLRSDTERATAVLGQALSLLRGTGDAYTTSMVVANLAEFALAAGELDTAQALVQEALTLGQQIDFRPLVAGMLELDAIIALERGDVDAASARMREALDVGIPFQSEAIAVRLTLSAAMAAIRRQPMRAAMLWAAAEHIDAEAGVDDRPIHARLRARWEAQAVADAPDRAAWDAAWRAGAQMSSDDALKLAAGWADGVDDPKCTGTVAAAS